MQRFVDSLARPGQSMTGMSFLALELVGKRLELLKEAAPKISRVAVLAFPGHPGEPAEWKQTDATARALGLTTRTISKYLKAGTLRCSRINNQVVRIRRSDLEGHDGSTCLDRP